MLLNEMIIEGNLGTIPSMGTSFELNETGEKIIELLKNGKTKGEIVQYFVDNGEDFGEVYKNVEDFILKLKTMGLL